MNKRIIVLVLLLLSVFFYSCSSNKSTTIKSKKVVIPTYSDNLHEEMEADKKKKKEKEIDPKQRHFNNQTADVQKAMKKNEKMSMKNTPVRKKGSSCKSPYCKKKRTCGSRRDRAMVNDGVRDARL